MAPFYVRVCDTLKWPVDEALLQRLRYAPGRLGVELRSHVQPFARGLIVAPVRRDENAAELEKLNASLADAQANLGQNEVLDAFKAKAAFFGRIGEKVRLLEGAGRCIVSGYCGNSMR